MAAKISILAVLVIVLACFSVSYAVNITKILEANDQFSTMNNLLTETGIAKELVNRSTVTVLALDNKAIEPITSLPKDVQKNVLMLHVILDYYGQKKLKGKPSTSMTSLYQSTGEGNGYLNASVFADKKVLFKSQVKGAHWNAELLDEVAVRPYNLSVQQISAPIGSPALDFKGADIPQPAPAPKLPPKAKDVDEEAEAPGPAEEEPVGSPAPAPAPDSESVADAPGESPPAPPADADKTKSGSTRIAAGVALIALGLVSSLVVA